MTKNRNDEHSVADPGHLRSASDKIGPDDPRYADLLRRGANKRFTGKPDYVRLVSAPEQVAEAVQEAVRNKLRVVARSGGHCLEGFVADPEVRVVIDTSLMTGVQYDPGMGAFVVEAGTTLGEMYRRLFLGWGVTIPAGISPEIGVGGHVLGGGFGYLSRQYGLAADHLYAVEVVVVDQAGNAKIVIATRETSDPNRDLWWAHTGGGGGNFGIVTRYWFKSPGESSANPSRLLPKAPDQVLRFKAEWNLEDIDETIFTRLVRNHGIWCENNSEVVSPYAEFYSTLFLGRLPGGKIETTGVLTSGARAEEQLGEYMAAINAETGLTYTLEIDHPSWLDFALYPFPDLVSRGSGGGSFKVKDALLRKRLTDRQIEMAYHYLTRTDYDGVGGVLGMATYGGKINSLSPGAMAYAQRGSILTMSCTAGWLDSQTEAHNLDWVRQFYRDLFADTGGVPVPGEAYEGALINHPDIDLADPKWNNSGIPWHRLYYKDNYARLQQIKAHWDPGNVFHHALSIRSP